MATGDQLKALLESYGEGDDDRFLAVAAQIAAHASRTGKTKLGSELLALVEAAREQHRARPLESPVPIVRPRGELQGLLVASYPQHRLSDMVLAPATLGRIQRVIREYRHTARLRAHGLVERRKLLLVGPPGCGKTMTAAVLAGELGLPLLAVQLHSLITKYMGETAAKLHLVFDAMTETRAVFLFDEFDAIGSRRGGQHDIGEIRRVLNSFLQFLERDDSGSVIVAATNLVEMLDDALFRRFDDVLHYCLPDAKMARLVIENRLVLFDLQDVDWSEVASTGQGLSHADLVRACEDAAKEAVLDDMAVIGGERLLAALAARAGRQRTAD